MIILLFAGGLNFYGPGTITPTGALTKEISRSFTASLTGTGIRWNNVYDIGTVAGTMSPTGALTRIVLIPRAGSITPAGTRSGYGGGSVAWVLDENVGFLLVPSKDGTLQLDENMLALTAVSSRDGLLQTDENVLVKAAPPVTSY